MRAHKAPFTRKLDDDTMPHLPNLVADLKVSLALECKGWGGQRVRAQALPRPLSVRNVARVPLAAPQPMLCNQGSPLYSNRLCTCLPPYRPLAVGIGDAARTCPSHVSPLCRGRLFTPTHFCCECDALCSPRPCCKGDAKRGAQITYRSGAEAGCFHASLPSAGIGKLAMRDTRPPPFPSAQAMQNEVPNPLSAYYGVQVYRLWDWQSVDKGGDPNAACGNHDDDGPPSKSPPSLLKLMRQQRPGGPCEHATGPYLFPDGSLEIMGRDALVAVYNSSRVRGWASRHFTNEKPPIWTHEDAALGALVHREVVERRLPLTFIAMRRWQHNVFWVNWADRHTLVSGNTLWAHYTRSAERSDYVAGAYLSTSGMPRDAFECASCVEKWGWTPPHDQVACCTKPVPKERYLMPGTISDARPTACGLSDGGATLQLGARSS
jgi:hypothetical protein